MSERRREVEDIKALLKMRVLDLVRTLAPDGRIQSGYWIARNPTRADKVVGSFYVWLTKAPGAWRDDATGEKGDIIGLVQYCTGTDFKAAIGWAKAWLNYEALPVAVLTQARSWTHKQIAVQATAEAGVLAKNRRRAFACYVDAKKKSFLGSPADRYLRGRGIEVGRLARLPGALGWIELHNHIETNSRWPVMVAGMSDASGGIVAIHRTWLAHDGSAKAPVTPARKIWPSFSGCAIRLWRGKTGMSVDEAAKQDQLDTLVLTEGVEDGLAVALSCPELRVWAVGSLGNLAHIVLPVCAGEVIVCADNDWGKPRAQRLLEQALMKLERQGKRVKVARSYIGKDANDALLGAQQPKKSAAA